jgi:hypothetical protein
MPDKTKKMAVDFKKEKGKWIVVAALSLTLILVYSRNFMKASSKGDTEAVMAQEQQVEVVDSLVPRALKDELKSYFPTAKAKDEVTKDILPFAVKDIFYFDPPSKAEEKEPEALAEEEETFVLKGTIIDGENSVAFLNDEVLAIGESLDGFTLVQIASDRAVLKNKEEKITVLLEDGIDEMF